MQEIKKIDIWSLTKIQSFFGLILGVLYTLVLIGMSFFTPNSPLTISFQASVWMTVLVLLGIIVFYIILGFFAGLILGFFYNLAAKCEWFGGIKIELKK